MYFSSNITNNMHSFFFNALERTFIFFFFFNALFKYCVRYKYYENEYNFKQPIADTFMEMQTIRKYKFPYLYI